MKFNRRSIFGLAAGAAVAPVVPALPAVALVVERIVLTPKPPFYGNAFSALTPTHITQQALNALRSRMIADGALLKHEDGRDEFVPFLTEDEE